MAKRTQYFISDEGFLTNENPETKKATKKRAKKVSSGNLKQRKGKSKTGRTVKNPIGTATTRTAKGQLKTASKSRVDTAKRQAAKSKLKRIGRGFGSRPTGQGYGAARKGPNVKGPPQDVLDEIVEGVLGPAIVGYEVSKNLPVENFKTIKELERGKMSAGERKVKPLSKDKNKIIRRKKGNQVLRDLKDRDPKKPMTPQEKKDIQKLKDNLKKDKQKPLTPKQKKLDVNKDGQLEASDFKNLRKKVVSAMTGGQIVAMMYDD